MTKPGKVAPVPKAVIGSVFYPAGEHSVFLTAWTENFGTFLSLICINLLFILSDQEAINEQPELQFKVSNIEMQVCETQTVIGASGSVGAVVASLKSTCKYLGYFHHHINFFNNLSLSSSVACCGVGVGN